MKKKNLSIFGAFFLLLFFSCDQQLDHAPPASDNASFAAFGGASARAYFEATATDLAPLSFSDRVEARTSGLELIPEWDKVSESGNGQVSLVEIPLWSNSVNIGTVTFTENGKIVCQKFFISRRRLVIARRSSGETDMFVVTLIPSVMAEGNPEKNMDNFRYLDGGGFSGQAFCSTLGGRFIEAWEYLDGRKTPLRLVSRKALEETGGTRPDEIGESFSFREMVHTRTGIYTRAEGDIEPPVDTVDMDEALVNRCRYCDAQLLVGETCYCQNCLYCGRYPCSCCKICGNTTCRCKPCACCPICKSLCKCSGCHQNPCVCCPGERCPECQGIYPWSAPETRSGKPCPLCVCWNKNTHHEIIDSIIRISGLDSAWAEEFKEADKWCDNFFENNQAVKNAYLHAMNTNKDQSPAEAQRVFENHLRARLNEFTNEGNIRALGIAIHGISDSFCPSHEGFQFIRLVSTKIIEHMKGDKGTNNPQAVQTAANCASGVVQIMKNGGPGSVERAIDYWRTTYQTNLNNR